MRRLLRQRSLKTAPFAGAALLPLPLLALPGPRVDVAELALGLGLTVIVLVGGVLPVWKSGARAPALAGGVLYFAAIALLRDGLGGNASGLGPLVLIPVVWFALYRGRIELTLSIAAAALIYWAPLVLGADPVRYPSSGWRVGLLFVGVAAILGYTIQDLQHRLREQSAQLAELALVDPLTGLANVRAWTTGLRRGVRLAQRSGRALCVVVIDVDHFKVINDREGHAGGDRVLTAAAAAWSTTLRRDDLLARIGGDEFAILLPDTDLASGRELVARLRAASGTPCSFGLARWDGQESATSLVSRADAALYEAKRAGRDRLALGA